MFLWKPPAGHWAFSACFFSKKKLQVPMPTASHRPKRLGPGFGGCRWAQITGNQQRYVGTRFLHRWNNRWMLNPKSFFYDLQLVYLEFSPSSRDTSSQVRSLMWIFCNYTPQCVFIINGNSQWNQGIIGLQSLQSTTCAGCYEQWATAADPRGAEGRQPGLSKELVLGTSKPAREEDNHL